MNFSKAIFDSISTNTDQFVTANGIDFVILTPRKDVSRKDRFYPGKAIVQIQGGKGQQLDYLRTIVAYGTYMLTKGDKISVTLKNGMVVDATFHHFYSTNVKNEPVRFIAHQKVDNKNVQIHLDITHINL